MMPTMTRLALTTLAVFALAGCGDGADKAGTETSATDDQPAASNQTLAATLKADGAYGGLSRVLANSGLETALDGVGPYTVFAPADAALKSAGGPDFTDPALKAEGAA